MTYEKPPDKETAPEASKWATVAVHLSEERSKKAPNVFADIPRS